MIVAWFLMKRAMKDKVTIITGASSGIGRETALALGAEKVNVVLAARRLEKLEDVARQVEAAGGTALAVPTDVSDQHAVRKLTTAAMERFGRIDVLINNAGFGLFASLEETTSEQMARIWRTNFWGTYYAIRSVLPIMKKQGQGHILTISSMAGRRGTPCNAAYCATKFAQAGLMESLRMELYNTGIHCTIVFPGPTDSEFLSALENPSGQPVRFHSAVQSPTEVARAIVKAIRHPKAEVITQRFGRTLIVLNALAPSLVDWLVARTVKRKLLRAKD